MGFRLNFVIICLGIATLSACIQAQPDPDVCSPGLPDASDKALPLLPNQFKAMVYAEFSGESNYTVSMTEFYDYINNQAAVWLQYQGETPPDIQKGTYKVFYRYDDAQYFTVFQNETDFGQNVCKTGELTNRTQTPFGFADNGHIQSTSDIYKFGEEYNETYNGQIIIDGQTMDWWSTCIYDEIENSTYKMDFYFVESEEKQGLPYMIVINGTVNVQDSLLDEQRNETDLASKNVPVSSQRQNFYTTYQFQDTEIGPQPLDQFLPPIGVMCPGRVPGKDLPAVPPWFALNVEVLIPERKTITYSKEYYHFSSKLVAYIEVISRKTKSRLVKEVHDFNTGIAYRITSEGVCHVNPIPIVADDAVSKDREHVSLRPPASFFSIHAKDVLWVYEGVTRNRDILVDVWQTYRTHWRPAPYHDREDAYVNSTWLYYFALEDWKIVGGETSKRPAKKKLPVKLEIEWAAHDHNDGKLLATGKQVHNFYQPDESIFEPVVYDISPCYSHINESLHLAFRLEGKDTYKKYIVNNTAQFYHGAIKSIADAVDASPTRIANFKVVDGYDDLANVFFTLLGRPQITGDALNATDPGPVLQTAYQGLQLLINNNNGAKLTLEFIYRGKEVRTVNAETDSLREETEPLTNTKHVGLSTAIVSGISVGSFLFGIAIALIGVFIVYKRRNTQIPYQLQE